MINMTVLNLKDIIRKTLKIIFAIILIVIIAKFVISRGNEISQSGELTVVENKIKDVPTNILTQIIGIEVPIIASLKGEKGSILPLSSMDPKEILRYELSILDDIEKSGININKEDLTQEDLEEIIQQGSIATEVQKTEVKETFSVEYGDVKIKNTSKYKITDDMLNKSAILNKEKNVLIYHTHTCESYTKTPDFTYKSSGNFRTKDLNYSVARVGDELEKYLKQFKFNVIHDKTYHDYPAYSGSYDRSYETVSKILSEHKDYELVFDIHRDAIGGNSSYAPTVKINDEYAAQLMFVIGTNGGGLEHPNWKENLRIAIEIQQIAEKLYPGLFKPILVSDNRYNQNLAKGASIIEVGATGNTMEQCLISMKYLSIILNELYK